MTLGPNKKLTDAIGLYAAQPDAGLLRLTQGGLEYIDLRNRKLSLYEKVQKFFGFGGFNLKTIWHFIDQNLGQDDIISIDRLVKASEHFDEKACRAFACWRVTKKVRDRVLDKLQKMRPGKSSGAELSESGSSEIKKVDPFRKSEEENVVSGQKVSGQVPVADQPKIEKIELLQASAEEEIALLREMSDRIPQAGQLASEEACSKALEDGIALLDKIFQTDRTHLSRDFFVQAVSIEFEIYDKVKKIKNSLNKINPNNSAILAFQTFVEAVPALKEIQFLKKELKNQTDESIRMLQNKFTQNVLGISVKELIAKFKQAEDWAEVWKSVRKNIFSGAQEWRSIQLDKNLAQKQLMWITGSSTASFVPIFKKMVGGSPALVPTGELLSHNIVPLTGEVAFGLVGVNKTGLSGVTLSDHEGALKYSEAAKGAFNYSLKSELDCVHSAIACLNSNPHDTPEVILLRLKIAAIRLGWAGVSDEIRNSLIEELNQVLGRLPEEKRSDRWEKNMDLLGCRVDKSETFQMCAQAPLVGEVVLVSRSDGTFSIGVVSRVIDNLSIKVQLDDAGYKICSPDSIFSLSDEDLANIRKENDTEAVKPEALAGFRGEIKSLHEKIQEVITLLTTTEKLELSDEERRFIESPGAILWGSMTKKIKDLKPVRSDIKGERALKGRQQLGSDIQLLFVEPERIDEARSYIKKQLGTTQKVHVVSREVIPFLHAHQSEHNEYGSFDPWE